jgi:hypothetical protein
MSAAPKKERKKTGKPTDFQGAQLEFLEAFMLTYIEASQNSMTRAIWDKFFLQYWAVFPWRLPLGQDPDPDNPNNYAAKPVDEAEEDAKSKLIEKMEDVGCVLVICDKILS